MTSKKDFTRGYNNLSLLPKYKKRRHARGSPDDTEAHPIRDYDDEDHEEDTDEIDDDYYYKVTGSVDRHSTSAPRLGTSRPDPIVGTRQNLLNYYTSQMNHPNYTLAISTASTLAASALTAGRSVNLLDYYTSQQNHPNYF